MIIKVWDPSIKADQLCNLYLSVPPEWVSQSL